MGESSGDAVGESRVAGDDCGFVFDHAPLGMALCQVDGDGGCVVLLANPALGLLFGVGPELLRGTGFVELAAAEERESVSALLGRLARGERTEARNLTRFRRGDDAFWWADLRVGVAEVLLPGTGAPAAATSVGATAGGMTAGGTTTGGAVLAMAYFVDVTAALEEARQRAQRAAMSDVLADVTTSVLAGMPLHRVYDRVAHGVAEVFDAENVTVGLPDPLNHLMSVVGAAGPISIALRDGDLPMSQAFVRRLMLQPNSALPDLPDDVDPRIRTALGPAAAARFGGDGSEAGLVTVARAPGGEPFSDIEVDLLGTLAQQLALAIELGRARSDQEELAVLQDRHRIARDLHDTVLQDLIGMGLQLSIDRRHEVDPQRRERHDELLGQLDAAIRALRAAVFELRGRDYRERLSTTVHAIASVAARSLGHLPEVTVHGPVDDVDVQTASEVTAVLREALSNVTRHASATRTAVALSADEEVTLVVEDNGRGLGESAHVGEGLANISERANLLAGTVRYTTPPGGGTRLTWRCPRAEEHGM